MSGRFVDPIRACRIAAASGAMTAALQRHDSTDQWRAVALWVAQRIVERAPSERAIIHGLFRDLVDAALADLVRKS